MHKTKPQGWASPVEGTRTAKGALKRFQRIEARLLALFCKDGHHGAETDIIRRVSIRTKETKVPDEFPPARLFLDDIEEIVRIFRELVESEKFPKHSTPEELEVKVTLSIGNKECDDVLELPKIYRRTKTSTLEIRVSKGWASTSLSIHRFGCFWGSSGFTKEDTWKAFHKLQPLFKARSPFLRSFVHSIPGWLFAASGFIGVAVLAPTLRFVLEPYMPLDRALAISLVLTLAFLFPLWVTKLLHTTVILRHSWEPSALRQELLHKIPLLAITSVLTFLLTLLGFYLKHKFWP